MKRNFLALAVAALLVAPVTAEATTTLEFILVDIRDIEDDPTMNTAGSYTKSTHPGGPSYGVGSGSIILEFQGDGTLIEDGPVSIVGGAVFNGTHVAVGVLIEVTADVTSSFIDGDNDNVGTLSNWDGESGTITWNEVLRMWPDDVWPGEGSEGGDGPATPQPDTLGFKVVNNGTLTCVGTLCGSLGTPPSGVTRNFVDHMIGWADPFGETAISFNDAFESPFGMAVPLFVVAYAAGGVNPAQELAMETEALPEPGAAASSLAALASLLVIRRYCRPSA